MSNFALGHLTSPNTKTTGSSLPLWDPENPEQQTPLPLHPKWKNVLTDHILDLADTLDLNEEVWRGLQRAKVIQKPDIERIKVFVIILSIMVEYLGT